MYARTALAFAPTIVKEIEFSPGFNSKVPNSTGPQAITPSLKKSSGSPALTPLIATCAMP